MNMSNLSTSQKADKPRKKWPLKTLIEIIPIIVALTAIFSYSTIKNVSDVSLVTPLSEVLAKYVRDREAAAVVVEQNRAYLESLTGTLYELVDGVVVAVGREQGTHPC